MQPNLDSKAIQAVCIHLELEALYSKGLSIGHCQLSRIYLYRTGGWDHENLDSPGLPILALYGNPILKVDADQTEIKYLYILGVNYPILGLL